MPKLIFSAIFWLGIFPAILHFFFPANPVLLAVLLGAIVLLGQIKAVVKSKSKWLYWLGIAIVLGTGLAVA